jgi:ribosomal protein L22
VSSLQVRYAATEIAPAKSARARGAYLRVSFKNTRETAQAINGWKLQRAVKFLENVQEHKEAVPMRRYAGGTGRAAQGTLHPFSAMCSEELARGKTQEDAEDHYTDGGEL